MNWACEKLGAKIVDFSSEIEGCEAYNILVDNLQDIWLSEDSTPQWTCISLAKINVDLEYSQMFDGSNNLDDNLSILNDEDKNSQNETVTIRTIGWHCWHR